MTSNTDSESKTSARRSGVLAIGALVAVASAACATEQALDDATAETLRAEATTDSAPQDTQESLRALFPPGQCDDVYAFRAYGEGGPGTPYLVQPGGEYHPKMAFDAPWGEEPVQAIAFKPLIDNQKVTHHWILLSGRMGWLEAWAPGNEGAPYPADVGMELPHGPKSLTLDMHYYNLVGTAPEPDRSGVAVCVVRGARMRPKTAAVHMGFAAIRFPMVPPNVRNHELTTSCKVTVKEPVTVFAVGPHAHRLGRHMKFTVTKADGREIVMHDQPFNFDEQGTYPLSPPQILETGDTVTTTCTYDNDSNRTYNFGESTDSEMCFNFALYYPKGALSCGSFGSLAGGLPPGISLPAGGSRPTL